MAKTGILCHMEAAHLRLGQFDLVLLHSYFAYQMLYKALQEDDERHPIAHRLDHFDKVHLLSTYRRRTLQWKSYYATIVRRN